MFFRFFLHSVSFPRIDECADGQQNIQSDDKQHLIQRVGKFIIEDQDTANRQDNDGEYAQDGRRFCLPPDFIVCDGHQQRDQQESNAAKL